MATNDRKSAREFLWKKHGDEALLDTYTGEELVEFAEAYAAERVSVLERALREILQSRTLPKCAHYVGDAVICDTCQYSRDLRLVAAISEAEAALGETESK